MAGTMQLITITQINSLKTDELKSFWCGCMSCCLVVILIYSLNPWKLSHRKHNLKTQINVEIVCKYVPGNDQTLLKSNVKLNLRSCLTIDSFAAA